MEKPIKQAAAGDAVIEAIRTTEGRFTKKQIMELCPEVSSRKITEVLKGLVQAEQIVRYGTGRSTFYVQNTGK